MLLVNSPQDNLFHPRGRKRLKGQPTLTSPLIGQQLVAFLATALKAAHCIPTHMITSPIVKAALINICEQKIIKRSGYIKSQQKCKEC